MQSRVTPLAPLYKQTEGGSFICYFEEKHILKLFPYNSCQYVSTESA